MTGFVSAREVPEIGEVRAFRFTPSARWLPLEGGTFAVNGYPALGALYGGVPGGNFTVEDFRGRAVYAADGSNVAGTLSGTDTRDLAHTHGAGTLATGAPSAVVSRGPPQILGNVDVATLDHTHQVTTGSTASALSSTDIRPARGYLRLYIRALP